jgi:hypothetical protein
MWQAVQIGGALLILAPFVLLQLRRTTEYSWSYLVANLAGSSVLTAVGLHEQQWGFVLLEGTWAAVSAYSIAAKWRGDRVRAA